MIEDESTSFINPIQVGKDLASLLKYRKTKFQTIIDQWDKTCMKCNLPERPEDGASNTRNLPKPL